jgi:hypothetical protein
VTKLSLAYYKSEQALVKIIVSALAQEINVETSRQYYLQLLEFLRNSDDFSRSALNEISVRFSEWLDDFDIRAKDPDYNKQKTTELIEWCESHNSGGRL